MRPRKGHEWSLFKYKVENIAGDRTYMLNGWIYDTREIFVLANQKEQSKTNNMKTGKAIKKPIPVEFIELVKTWTCIRKAYEFVHGKPPYEENASTMTKNKWEEYMDICIHDGFMPLKTLESGQGTQNANFGDYILKGIDGECWPIKADIFERTYDII